jgi:hypothetical protein
LPRPSDESPPAEAREAAPSRAARRGPPASVVAAWVLGLAILGLAGPSATRALAARWREIHTPGSGRARVLTPDVLAVVAALESAGARSFMFTPALASEAGIAPFVLEASWPIECRPSAEHIVGYARELATRPDCVLLRVVGKVAVARCHL